MAFSSKAIANYFLDLEISDPKKHPITPMKLQKLVFYSQGWYLALRDEPLVHEQVECWEYGPVFRTLYHEFKSFGNNPIKDKAIDVQIVKKDGKNRFNLSEYTIEDEAVDTGLDVDFTKRFLNRMWEIYGKYSGIQLSNMTHEEGSPWTKTYKENNNNPPVGTDIPLNRIKNFFKSQLKD